MVLGALFEPGVSRQLRSDMPVLSDRRKRCRRIGNPYTNRTSSLATCVVSICEAILRGENEVFPVSAMVSGEPGMPGVYLNMLCLLGHKGVKRVVKKPVTPCREPENAKARLQSCDR